jgi:transposase
MALVVASGKVTLGDVAQMFGVSVSTVVNACRENGVTSRAGQKRGPMDPARAAEVVRRFLSGENKQTIGIDIGITRERVRQVVAAFERDQPNEFAAIKRGVLREQLAALDGAA